MDQLMRNQIISIIDDVDDMTIATVRDDGYPQAMTVSYVNDRLAIYFGTSADSQKARYIAQSNKVSATINRDYSTWDEIEGLSIGGIAMPVTDPMEQDKAGSLLFKKFPQIAQHVPTGEDAESFALFRIDPKAISLIDYRQGFGHTELVEL